MPSSASTSVLAELQAAGENLNTWGVRLNTALQMLEAAGHGLTSHTLTASKSLTYTNYTATDGTDYVQKIAAASDGAYTLTVGGYERMYLIWNASSYDQTIACSGGGDSVTVYAGEIVPVYCDATNMARLEVRRVNGHLSLGAEPTSSDHAATKLYVDQQAFATVSGDFPAQPGNALTALSTNGTAPSWEHDINPETVSASATLTARRRPYRADLSGGPLTFTLPANPSEGDYVQVITDENADTDALTIARNGETIMGLAEDMTIRLKGTRAVLVYLSFDWKVYA